MASPDPAAPAPGHDRQAGLVLALLGPLVYGSTSPFALVLCVEWLLDPARPARLRWRDRLGVFLALPGAVVFVLVCVAMWGYPLGEPLMARLIVAYGCVFGVWLLVRSRTRWCAIAARRAAGRPPVTPARTE